MDSSSALALSQKTLQIMFVDVQKRFKKFIFRRVTTSDKRFTPKTSMHSLITSLDPVLNNLIKHNDCIILCIIFDNQSCSHVLATTTTTLQVGLLYYLLLLPLPLLQLLQLLTIFSWRRLKTNLLGTSQRMILTVVIMPLSHNARDTDKISSN